jgi:nucleoside-diphosphate-sugar epimerase
MGVTVAVVGATGTIGRAVTKAFADNGYEVRAVARRRAAHLAAEEFIEVDVASEPLDGLFDGVDAVVNAAGSCWDLSESEMDYQHVRLVHRILDALRGTLTRLVHIGSIHEYGPVPEGTLIDESIPARPASAYARAKLAGSQAVLSAQEVDAVVLRAVNVCGPHTGGAGFLRAVLTQTGGPLIVAPSKRDYLDVRDLAVAVVLAASAPVNGRVLNIGSGVATDLRELAWMLADQMTIVDGPTPSNGGGWTCADIRLAEHLLHWRPQISLRESIRALRSTR